MRKELLVTDFLDRARTYYGNREALLATTGERYTYDDLGQRADRFSAALQARGVEKGDRVAVIDPNTHYHMAAAHGTMQMGGVHTPLNYRLTPDDYAYILDDADADLVYADYEYASKVEAVRGEIQAETFVTNDADAVEGDWIDFEAMVADAGTDYDRPEMSEDEVITINYTSGTTGDPKGVMRTHRTETLHAFLISIHHNISDDDVYLWTLPMFHANGWGHIFALTGLGTRQICTRGVDIEGIFESVVAEDVSYLCAAPTVLDMLIDHYETHEPESTGDRDVRVATGGSAPPEATIRTVEDGIGWHLQHIYGATETAPLTMTSDFDRFYDGESEDRFGIKKRQGIGFLGTEIDVVDEDGDSVPRDDETIGEIVIDGHQVMEGYRNKPEATDRAFHDRVDGWYHSGDLATVNRDGFISIKDRKKDIIVSGGENISSVELEDVLYDHDAVGAVAVIPSPSDQWGETPKAFVVPESGDPDDPGVTPEELCTFTRERLAKYKALRRVEFVDELPTTATGKVQKYSLREREWADEESMVGQG